MIHKIFILLALLLVSTAGFGASFTSGGLKLDVGETTTSAGILTLTRASSQVQRFIGSSSHTLKLPDAGTLLRGWWYKVSNDSTGSITVLDNGSNGVGTISSGNAGELFLYNNSSTNGSWDLTISSSTTTAAAGGSWTRLTTFNRVTGSGPDTTVGNYRSYLRNGSARTFTETNGSPTTSPSSTDGIKIYADGTWGSGSSANSPVRYEFYIGTDKQVKLQFYGTTGRTAPMDVSVGIAGTSTVLGYAVGYDPITGIVSVCAPNFLGGGMSNAQQTGIFVDDASGTPGDSTGNAIYFDIYYQ